MYVGAARSHKDVELARSLSEQVFGGILGQDRVSRQKAILWADPEMQGAKNVIILSPAPGNVVGVVRVLPRLLYRADQRFPCAGISSVCVAPKWRGQGLSKVLLNSALDEAHELGFHVALLFSRRAVDNYYVPFGFFGLASYAKLRVPVTPSLFSLAGKVTLQPLHSEDLALCNQYYELAYANAFGRMSRSSETWNYLLEKTQFLGMKFHSIMSENQFVGYVVLGPNTVVEVAMMPGAPTTSVIAAIAIKRDLQEVILEIPVSHPVVSALEELDVSLSTRQCVYGGHMLKILDADSMLLALSERVTSMATRLRLAPMATEIEGVQLSWNGCRARASIAHQFDGTSFSTVARVLGISTLTSSGDSFLDPLLPFDVSEPDHL